MARLFPGANGNTLTVGDTAAVDVTGLHLTLAAWVMKLAAGGNQFVLTKDSGITSTAQWRLTCGGGAEGLVYDSGGFDQAAGATTVPVGQWHHIAFVKDGTGAGAVRVYLDGKLDGSATSNRTIKNTATAVVIGNRAANDTPMNGLIAHAAVWNAALRNDELIELARGALPLRVRLGNLRGYWPLEDHSGRDLSAFNSPATLAGTVTVRPGPFLPNLGDQSIKLPVLPRLMIAPFIAATTVLFPQGVDRAIFATPLTLRWARN